MKRTFIIVLILADLLIMVVSHTGLPPAGETLGPPNPAETQVSAESFPSDPTRSEIGTTSANPPLHPNQEGQPLPPVTSELHSPIDENLMSPVSGTPNHPGQGGKQIPPKTTTNPGQLQKEIQAIHNELNMLKEALAFQRTQRKYLESRIAELETRPPPIAIDTVSQMINKAVEEVGVRNSHYREHQKVYFSAKVDSPILDHGAWETIVFARVEANQGDAYNNVTGEFRAPRGGWYVFYSTILSKTDGVIETSLQVNGVNKMYLYSAGTGAAHGSGSNMVVVHLSAGDVVKMVKHGPWGTPPFYVHPSWSSFSGFLLRSDSTTVPSLTSPPDPNLTRTVASN